MEGQLQRTHEHQRYDEDPHHHAGLQSVVEGEGEAEHHNHHGEKKSVLTKVKNKAKKIKDKIKHAGHAHEGDDYDDYYEDEETVNAPHVHGAPLVNESEFISGTALPKQTGLNLENPMNPLEDRQSHSARDEVYDDVMVPDRQHVRNDCIGNDQVIETSPLLEDPYIRKEEYCTGAGDVGWKMAVDAPTSGLLDPLPPTFDSERRANVAEPTVKIGPLEDLEEDPHFTKTPPHPPNYQTKVSDPTGQGGAEVDVAPLVDRLGNLQVGDEYESGEMAYTGSHDQFAPLATPTSEQLNPKSLDAESMLPRDTVAEKISAATSMIADKASSAKDVVASKLGYGGSAQNQNQVVAEEPTQRGALESVSEYGHIVAEKLSPVYEKAAGAIMSKMQRGGGEGVKESDKGVSVQEYLVEKFSPGEEDRELSKVISHALRGEGQQQQQQQPQPQPAVVEESVRVEAVVSDEKEAAGVVDRVKGAIGSWLGKNPRGHPGDGLEKEIASKLQE